MLPERLFWLAFSAFPLIGPKRFALLFEYFRDARTAWQADAGTLLKLGLRSETVNSFVNFRNNFDLKSYFNELKREGISFLTLADSDYPANLKEIDDAPFLLYIKGRIKKEDEIAIGVVGSRRATTYGQQVTQSLVKDLVLKKITIISGLAFGVDTIAHQTALDGGRTIGVWAGGLDTLVGFQKRVSEEIVRKGSAILSEFPLGFSPNKTTFPQRNRIISGLSLGILVTEAAARSGSLITASFAASQGREVFAVPGPITSFYSAGTAFLLKQGAKLVTNVEDILEEIDKEEKNHYL